MAGFPWSECQVKKLATSHCTNHNSISFLHAETALRQELKKRERRVCFSRHTRESVQSPLVVLKLKVRKGGDFFYGKSSNENHTESV